MGTAAGGHSRNCSFGARPVHGIWLTFYLLCAEIQKLKKKQKKHAWLVTVGGFKQTPTPPPPPHFTLYKREKEHRGQEVKAASLSSHCSSMAMLAPWLYPFLQVFHAHARTHKRTHNPPYYSSLPTCALKPIISHQINKNTQKSQPTISSKHKHMSFKLSSSPHSYTQTSTNNHLFLLHPLAHIFTIFSHGV